MQARVAHFVKLHVHVLYPKCQLRFVLPKKIYGSLFTPVPLMRLYVVLIYIFWCLSQHHIFTSDDVRVVQQYLDWYHQCSWNCLLFQGTRFQFRLLVRILLVNLQFSVYYFLDRLCVCVLLSPSSSHCNVCPSKYRFALWHLQMFLDEFTITCVFFSGYVVVPESCE